MCWRVSISFARLAWKLWGLLIVLFGEELSESGNVEPTEASRTYFMSQSIG